jgi:hypothetical protein
MNNHKTGWVTDSAQGSIDAGIPPNTAPVLSGGGVSPASGTDTDTYEYTVTYTDAEGDIPGYVKVSIDGSAGWTMTLNDGTGDTYTTGEVYRLQMDGSTLGMGDHTFAFSASDGTEAATGDTAQHNGPSVGQSNRAPALSARGVDPTEGTSADQFNYTVTYTDPDDDPPSMMRLVVDGGIPLDMTPEDPADTDYTDGAVFVRLGVTLEAGTAHTYSFQAGDGMVDATGTGPFSGPVVGSPNNKVPRLEQPALFPQSGTDDDTFDFTVVYTDLDGEAPSGGGPVLIIDGGSRGPLAPAGTRGAYESSAPQEVVMDPDPAGSGVLRNSDYTDGEIYIASLSLPAGEHTYGFRVSDGTDAVATEEFDGPRVLTVHAPEAVISWPENGSVHYDVDGLFIDGGNSTDPDGDALTYSWSSNLTGELSSDASILLTDMQVGFHLLTLTVDDGVHGFGRTTTEVRVVEAANNAPFLWPLSPTVWGEDTEAQVQLGGSLEFSLRMEEPDGDDVSIMWYRDGEEWGIPSDLTSPAPEVKWSQDVDGPTYQARELGTYEVSVTVFDSGYPPLNTSITWTVEVLDVPDDPDGGGGGGGHGNGGGGGGGGDDADADLDPGYEYGTLESEDEGIALYKRPLALALVAAIIAVAIIGILYIVSKDKKKKQGGAVEVTAVDEAEMDICEVGPWDTGKSAPPPPMTPAGPSYNPRQPPPMTPAGPPYDPTLREGTTGHQPGYPGYHGDPYGYRRGPQSPPAGREYRGPPPEGRSMEYLDEY